MSEQLSAVEQPLDKQKDKQNSSRLLDSLVLDILDGWCCYNNTTHLRIHSPASSLSAFLSQHHMGFFRSFVSTGMCVNCLHSKTRSHLCVLPFLLLQGLHRSLPPGRSCFLLLWYFLPVVGAPFFLKLSSRMPGLASWNKYICFYFTNTWNPLNIFHARKAVLINWPGFCVALHNVFDL